MPLPIVLTCFLPTLPCLPCPALPCLSPTHQPSATQKPFQESVVEGTSLTQTPLSKTFLCRVQQDEDNAVSPRRQCKISDLRRKLCFLNYHSAPHCHACPAPAFPSLDGMSLDLFCILLWLLLCRRSLQLLWSRGGLPPRRPASGSSHRKCASKSPTLLYLRCTSRQGTAMRPAAASLTECPPPVHRLRQPPKAQDPRPRPKGSLVCKYALLITSSPVARALFLLRGTVPMALRSSLCHRRKEIPQAWESRLPCG